MKTKLYNTNTLQYVTTYISYNKKRRLYWQYTIRTGPPLNRTIYDRNQLSLSIASFTTHIFHCCIYVNIPSLTIYKNADYKILLL